MAYILPMSMGLYVHIPFCLQRCTYCDFATAPWTGDSAAKDYMGLLQQELTWAKPLWPSQSLKSVYFGGGTPSLLPPDEIVDFLGAIEKDGVRLHPTCEVTLEINPGTLSRHDLKLLVSAGVNRFSVGAQTFDDRLLAPLGREHSAQSTLETLEILSGAKVNYSVDLLYGLPGQSLEDFRRDLAQIEEFSPPHVSTYNLTLPERHPLQVGRAPDDQQVDMYHEMLNFFSLRGLTPYEISNFARPGYESRHNQIYWQGGTYWALGMSGHSFLPLRGEWGTRFWNPNSKKAYESWVSTLANHSFEGAYPPAQREDLTMDQHQIDLVHTRLRQTQGLSDAEFLEKFSRVQLDQLKLRAHALEADGLIIREENPGRLRLSLDGRLLFNAVLRELFV